MPKKVPTALHPDLRANENLEAFFATAALYPGLVRNALGVKAFARNPMLIMRPRTAFPRPRQIVEAPREVWQQCRWLRGRYSAQRRVGVVLETTVSGLTVRAHPACGAHTMALVVI